MMNDNMKLVIKALRSGEYKQTKETLQDKDGYCCLGVMCAVYESVTGNFLRRDGFSGELYGGDLGDQKGVKDWVGLRNYIGESHSNLTLAELNDDESYTFLQIADYIESEPQGLLV
jgi:hypothetical protein